MNTILRIKQSDIELGFIMPENASWHERHAARAVLFDEIGRIALLHASVRGYYKLPGGGVEEGEDMRAALARELLEEVGAEAEVISEVGRVEEWRCLDDRNLHQISDAYLAKVAGDVGEPDFTEKELADGFSVVWADAQDAIKMLETTLDHSDSEVRFMTLRDSTILKTAVQE